MICPDCKWETPTTKYRFRKNGDIYIYKNTEQVKHSCYPKILEVHFDWKNRRIYREVHKCPSCNFEFEQTILEE